MKGVIILVRDQQPVDNFARKASPESRIAEEILYHIEVTTFYSPYFAFIFPSDSNSRLFLLFKLLFFDISKFAVMLRNHE